VKVKDILLEYDRSKTIDQMGNAIANAAKNDPALTNPRIKDQELSSEQVSALSRNVLGQIESVDPTPNKKYVLWIVRQFVKNGLKFEDINELLKVDIERFHELPKQRKQQLDIETDLNKYTWRDLREIADKLKKTADLENPIDAKLDYEHIDEMKVLYVGDMGQLIIPKTTAASCEIGSGTRWCTAASQSNNMFSSYSNDGPLYVWIPSRKMPEKKSSNKYQFHFPSLQFMDENDRQIDQEKLDYFRTQHPVLKKLFAKGEKEIAQDPRSAYDYARDIIQDRFPEGEKTIAKDPVDAIGYARYIIGGRFPEAEPAIAQRPFLALRYARYIINGRFPEAEPAIAKDPEAAVWYAQAFIQSRWSQAEPAIAQDPVAAFRYADLIIDGRFLEGEEAIRTDPAAKSQYEREFGVDLDKEAGQK